MINKCFKALSKELIDYRKRKRDFYNSEEGEKELFNFLYDHKAFSLIGPEDIQLRNMAIKKLEELGLLDESRIREMLHNLLQESTAQSERIELEEYKNEDEEYSYTFDPDRE